MTNNLLTSIARYAVIVGQLEVSYTAQQETYSAIRESSQGQFTKESGTYSDTGGSFKKEGLLTGRNCWDYR